MRTLLTGSTGFVGRNLLPKLNGDIYCFKRGDDINKVRDFKPDIVYHCAAELYDEPIMYQSNVALTHNLLEAVYQVDKRVNFIYIGTSSEYGISDKPMSEDDDCNPTTMYALTKYIGTQQCLRRSWLNRLILRPFSLYGENEDSNRFFTTLINKAKKHETIDVWEGNHDWIHIDDFIDGLFYFSNRLIKEPEMFSGQIINLATGIQTSNFQVVEMLEKYLGKLNIIKHQGHYRKGDSDMWVADTSKAKSLDWQAKISLEEGLRRLCAAKNS